MRGRRKGRGSAGVDKSTTTSGPTRSKTIMGRKLRLMSVEKGLLRETKIVQRMTDSLLECRVSLAVHPSRNRTGETYKQLMYF